jgi:hypothetical protein
MIDEITRNMYASMRRDKTHPLDQQSCKPEIYLHKIHKYLTNLIFKNNQHAIRNDPNDDIIGGGFILYDKMRDKRSA